MCKHCVCSLPCPHPLPARSAQHAHLQLIKAAFAVLGTIPLALVCLYPVPETVLCTCKKYIETCCCCSCWWLTQARAVVAGSSEERMMQLLRLVNGLLEKHPESRSRRLAAHAPIIVPVYSQVRSPLQSSVPAAELLSVHHTPRAMTWASGCC